MVIGKFIYMMMDNFEESCRGSKITELTIRNSICIPCLGIILRPEVLK